MNKDEMKNKISMALKDPILQQGFEIICKENAEFKEQLYAFDEEREKLRKENAELKADNDARKFAMAMSEKVEKQLREENAELKKKKEEIEIMTNFCKACKKMHTDNLTKAKEILKRFIELDVLDCYDIVEEAEQFINELKNDR